MTRKRPRHLNRVRPRPSIVLPCELATWPAIEKLLIQVQKIESTDDLATIMLKIHDFANISIDALNSEDARPNPTKVIDEFRFIVDHQFSAQQRLTFFKRTLPCMAKYAVCLPGLKPSKTSSRQFSLLCRREESTMSLDRRFVASLIANAIFFSTFPVRAKSLSPELPDICFGSMFNNISSSYTQGMRLKNLLNYFDTLSVEEPCGRITYSRHLIQKINGIKTDQNQVARNYLQNLGNELEMQKAEKPLSQVFVMSDGSVLDINNRLSELIICDFSSNFILDDTCDDGIIHHPEILVGLMFIESTTANEWVRIGGILTSRVKLSHLGDKIQHQICFIDKTPDDDELGEDESCHAFIIKELWRHHNSLHISEEEKTNDEENCYLPPEETSDNSSVSSRLEKLAEKFSTNLETSRKFSKDSNKIVSRAPSAKESKKKGRPTFSERLRAALERGNTPESTPSRPGENPNLESNIPENIVDGLVLEKTRRVKTMDREQSNESNISDESIDDSQSGDSIYSFDFGFDVESEFETDLRDWVSPEDILTDDDTKFYEERKKFRRKFVTKLAARRLRRSLSEPFSDVTTNLDLLSDGIQVPSYLKNCKDEFIPIGRRSFSWSEGLSKDERCLQSFPETKSPPDVQEEESKPCLWIISSTFDLDPSRFIVQWLAASLHDIPLVMYQTKLVHNNQGDDERDDDFGEEIVASICSGVEERNWDAKKLLSALLDSRRTSLFDESNGNEIFDTENKTDEI